MADPAQDRRPRFARIRSSGAVVLIHPCSVCGRPQAPFGQGVDTGKQKLGTWFCRAHLPANFLPKPKTSTLI